MPNERRQERGWVVFKETVRSTPIKHRVGQTLDERREAQRTKPAKERLGTRPPTLAFERLGAGRDTVDREAKRKSQSARDRDSASSRQSIPRRAKAVVQNRGQKECKLDGQLGGCYFPIREETTTDIDTDTDSEASKPKK